MSEIEQLRRANDALLWHIVDSHRVIEKVEEMMKVVDTFRLEMCQMQARYERAIKDAGMKEKAKEIRDYIGELDDE